MDGEKDSYNNQPKPTEQGQEEAVSSSVQELMPNDNKKYLPETERQYKPEEEEPGCLKKICETVPEKRCFQADHHYQSQSGCQEVPMEDCTAYVQTYTEHVCSNETGEWYRVCHEFLSRTISPLFLNSRCDPVCAAKLLV